MPQAPETAAPDAKGMSQAPETASPDAKGMPDVPEAASPDAEMLSLAPGLVHHTPSQSCIVFSDEKKIARIYLVFL
jgi:hypothetical protein